MNRAPLFFWGIMGTSFNINFGMTSGIEQLDTLHVPYCIAHRGGPTNYGPENLLSSSVAAATEGASVEVDVRNSSDGTAWIMHDWDVARTTNGSGGVINSTDSYLNSLVADGTSSEGIPTWLEILNGVHDAHPKAKVICHYNAGDWTQANIEAIQADVDTADMNDRVIWSSWLPEHLQGFMLYANSDIERMQILAAGEAWDKSEYQTSILVGAYADLSLQKVQEYQANGYVIHTSAGDDAGYRHILATGADSNMTDNPEGYWIWLGRYCTGSL